MNINFDLSESEVKSLKEWIPKVQHFKAIIPPALLTLVHKVEQAIKEM